MKFPFTLRKTPAALLYFCLSIWAIPVAASASEWMTDIEAAKAKAAEEDKPMLLNFTGSDWCPPCMYLEKAVFAKEAFKKYADDSLILLKLDFPRRTPQPAALRKQNMEAAELFEIEAFPTLILVNSEGEEVDRQVGVVHPEVDGFVEHLRSKVDEI